MALNINNAAQLKKPKIHTNAQYALKNQLEGKKLDPIEFGPVVENICHEFGFKILLEIPSCLVDKKIQSSKVKQTKTGKGTAIAILCPTNNGYSLLFAICKSKRSKIGIFDENQITNSIVELAWSYAMVLSLLPRTQCLNNK